MSVRERVFALVVVLVFPCIFQTASGQDGPYFIHSGVQFLTDDVNYITHVGDSFEITVTGGKPSDPPDYEVCDPDFPPFQECYRIVGYFGDLEIVSGLPAGATVTPQNCVTFTVSGASTTFCPTFLIEWKPVPPVFETQRIVVRAAYQLVTFKYDADGDRVPISIDGVSQIASSNVDISVTELDLASVEITQVIQVGQSPEDLQEYLDNHNGEPPIPIVAEKDVALRVIPGQVTVPTDVDVEVWTRLIEPSLDDSPLEPEVRIHWPLSRKCTADHRRLRVNIPPATCRSIDIYQKPGEAEVLREGKGDFWVFLKYPNSDQMENLATSIDQEARVAEVWDAKCSPAPDGHDRRNDPSCRYLYSPEYLNRFDANRFTLTTKKSDEMLLGAVNVCTSLDNSQCLTTPVRDLARRIRLLEKFAPTHAVTVGGTGPGTRVHLGLARDDDGDRADCYDRSGTKTLNGWFNANGDLSMAIPLGQVEFCESDVWWHIALIRVEDAFARSGHPRRSIDKLQTFFMGVAQGRPLHSDIKGIASPGGNTALVKVTETLLQDEKAVAHETGHMLGLNHTFGPESTWPYLFEKIISGHPVPPNGAQDFEVGLDVQERYRRRAAKDGAGHYDIMSYEIVRNPAWISPLHYKIMLDRLDPPPADPPAEPGSFWLVSGFLTDGAAMLQPLFEFEATARTDAGDGLHRIEIIDDNGGVLFTRSFTPRRGETLAATGAPQKGLPIFSEMIPVQPAARRIAIFDDADNVRETLAIGGTAPDVSIADLPGGILSGLANIDWSVTDPDSTEHVYWVEYSADGGTTWSTLAQSRYEPNLEVDFGALPGSNGNALIRVLASDGVNTGSAVSNLFSVSSKLPESEIFVPELNEEYYAFDGVVLEGFGYDVDDGVLTDASLVWESDRFGFLGTGEELSIPELPIGEHVITLTATDSDGNRAFDTVTFRALDGLPTEVPTDPRPIADAGGPYQGDEGEAIVFDGSTSFDPEGGVLVHGWDFGDGATGAGVMPSHTYTDDGDFNVTLTVIDPQSLTASETVTAQIRNVAPEVVAQPGPTAEEGDTATLLASFSDPGVNDGPWEVLWNYGDGLSVQFDVAAPGDIAADHAYSQAGIYMASVTVYDKDGSPGIGTFEVVINDILIDTDGDGVNDADDQCPGTPAGEAVDANGCSASQLDDDGDGVTNDLDQCPGTPTGEAVDTNGCSASQLDTDGDGVNDSDDNCPSDPNPDQADNENDGLGDICDSDDDNDTVPDLADNCPIDANTEQNDFDMDSIGDACDADIDGDGVSNDQPDICPETPLGAVTDASTGCSIAQLCPCDGPRGTTEAWRNHGKYVSCVAQTATSFVELGLISEDEKGAIVSAAGQSSCGKK